MHHPVDDWMSLNPAEGGAALKFKSPYFSPSISCRGRGAFNALLSTQTRDRSKMEDDFFLLWHFVFVHVILYDSNWMHMQTTKPQSFTVDKQGRFLNQF